MMNQCPHRCKPFSRNYSVVQLAGLNASISAASLAVIGVSAVDKTYDATRIASLIGAP